MNTNITIPGRPIPAVRMTGRGKFSNDAQRYLAYKGFISTITRAYFPRPSKKKITIFVHVYLNGKTTPMGKDGDVDNYLKTALDGLNKIAWVDDRQVNKAYVTKNPCLPNDERMEIMISEIEEG